MRRHKRGGGDKESDIPAPPLYHIAPLTLIFKALLVEGVVFESLRRSIGQQICPIILLMQNYKTYCASCCTDGYLIQKPFSFKSTSFLIGYIMMATNFCNIIKKGMNWHKPTIFLTKPFYE